MDTTPNPTACHALHGRILDLGTALYGAGQLDVTHVRTLTFLLTTLLRPAELLCGEITVRGGLLVVPDGNLGGHRLAGRTVPLSRSSLAVLDGADGRLATLLGCAHTERGAMLRTLATRLVDAAPEGIDHLEDLWAHAVHATMAACGGATWRSAVLAYAGITPTARRVTEPAADMTRLRDVAEAIDGLVEHSGYSTTAASIAA